MDSRLPETSRNSPFPPGTEDLIRRKARVLSQRTGFTISDRDDLAQELRIHLLGVWIKYDQTRPWMTYATYVLDKKCIDLHRKQSAIRRRPLTGVKSLSGDAVAVDRRTVSGAAATPNEAFDLKSTVEDAIADLPPQTRLVAHMIMTGSSKNAVGRKLSLSRRQVAAQFEMIKAAIADADLSPPRPKPIHPDRQLG